MIFSLILICSGALGATTALIIFNKRKENVLLNNYGVFLTSFISIKFLVLGIDSLDPLFFPERLTNHLYVFSLLLIPCCYLYFKTVLAGELLLKPAAVPHFIFPPIYALLHLFVIPNVHSSWRFSMFGAFFLYLLFYLWSFFKYLKPLFSKKQRHFFLFEKQKSLLKSWVLFVFVIFSLILARLFFTIFTDIFRTTSSLGRESQWVAAVFWSFVFIKLLSSPEILFGYSTLFNKIKKHRDADFTFADFWILATPKTMNNANDRQLQLIVSGSVSTYFHDIEHFVLRKKVFRNAHFTLTNLVNMLGVPKSHLTYLFKYHVSITFIEFKKRIQIYDAIDLISEGYLIRNTLESLSKKVGFSSYNPFFTSFKEITGKTPAGFAKEKNKIKQVER